MPNCPFRFHACSICTWICKHFNVLNATISSMNGHGKPPFNLFILHNDLSIVTVILDLIGDKIILSKTSNHTKVVVVFRRGDLNACITKNITNIILIRCIHIDKLITRYISINRHSKRAIDPNVSAFFFITSTNGNVFVEIGRIA